MTRNDTDETEGDHIRIDHAARDVAAYSDGASGGYGSDCSNSDQEDESAGIETERVGEKIMYHATSRKAASMISSAGEMRCGSNGMFGGGIYFADTEDRARYKSRHDGSVGDVVITARVDLGRALVLTHPDTEMSLAKLRANGCDSVKGRSHAEADWEYVVYESDRVHIVDERINVASDTMRSGRSVFGMFAGNSGSDSSDDDLNVHMFSTYPSRPSFFVEHETSHVGYYDDDDDDFGTDYDAEADLMWDEFDADDI